MYNQLSIICRNKSLESIREYFQLKKSIYFVQVVNPTSLTSEEILFCAIVYIDFMPLPDGGDGGR